MSALHTILDNQWLYKEVYTKLGLSAPAYKYWKETPSLKLNRYLFLEKETLPQRYRYIEKELTDLTGYLPVQYASAQLGLDNHVFNYKKMRLYGTFEYKFVNDIKFVNIRRFFLEHNIRVNKKSMVRVGKIDDLLIYPNSRFYRIDESYGVVVYD